MPDYAATAPRLVGKDATKDVEGVRVGHATLVRGDNVRTGVTAIVPHGGNLFQEKVPAAIFVGNGFGKIIGTTQVEELGEIETPILLTSTLNVPRVADALIDYMLALPGNESVRSINLDAASLLKPKGSDAAAPVPPPSGFPGGGFPGGGALPPGHP